MPTYGRPFLFWEFGSGQILAKAAPHELRKLRNFLRETSLPCLPRKVAMEQADTKLVVPVNMEKGEGNMKQARTEITFQPTVEKQNGEAINSDLFLSKGHEQISAILYSGCNLGTMLLQGHGKDLEMVHNGFAKNPVQHGLLDGVRYSWVEQNRESKAYQLLSVPKRK